MHQKQHWIVTGDVLFNYKHSGSIKMHAAYFKILIQNVYCKKLQFFVVVGMTVFASMRMKPPSHGPGSGVYVIGSIRYSLPVVVWWQHA